MRAVPKPKSSSKSGATKPKLTEEDFLAISEKIAESMDFGNQVEIMVFHNRKTENVRGIIRSACSQVGKLTLWTDDFNEVKIDINSIVGIK